MMKTIASLLFFLLMVPPAPASAQTGTLAGSVTDQQTGAPLPGVHLALDGTPLHTATDADGFFVLLNVHPGTYTLRASTPGYTTLLITGVRVHIDLTTEVDIPLQTQALGLDELTVSATEPIIRRDVAASERTLHAAELTAGRYQHLAHVLTAHVGATDISQYEDIPEIRGSGFEESLLLVDGVAQVDPLTRRPYYSVNLDAVEEIKIQTGSFSAEYGNVRSGLINVVTREGGQRYAGSINVQYSRPGYKHFGPGLFDFDSPVVAPFVDPALGAFEEGNAFFEGWNAIATDLAEDEAHADRPMELYARYLWRHRSQEAIDELKRLAAEGIVQFAGGVDPDALVFHQTGVEPDYRVSATLGGPMPLLDGVTFFVSYDGRQSEYAYRFPERSYVDHNIRGKVTAGMGRGMKLTLYGFYSRQQGETDRDNIGARIPGNPFSPYISEVWLWHPHARVPGLQRRQFYGAQWTHALTSKTVYEIRLTHDRVDYDVDTQWRNTAPVPGSGGATSSWKISGSGIDAGRIGTEAEAEARAAAGQEGWANWRDWALIRIGEHWYDEAPRGYTVGCWRDVTGLYRMDCGNVRADETATRGWDLSGSLTSRLNRAHRLKAGFNLRRDEIDQYYEMYQYVDASAKAGSAWDSKVDPVRGAVYLQDKLAFGGFVANVGVRLDVLQTGAFPITMDCDLTDPADCAGDGGPYSRFFAGGNTTVDVEGGRVLGLKETVIADSIGAERKTHARISPRVGISYPIETVAKVFVNYGHFYQWPTARQLYTVRLDSRPGYELANSDSWGNPLLEPERTIQYEVGYEHNLFDKMLLRLTGYFKDINNEISDVEIFPLSYEGRDYETWMNMRSRDVRGLEGLLELRRGALPYLSGWISANYLVESDAEYGFDRFYEDPTQEPRPTDTQTRKSDLRPILRANLDLHTPDDFLGPSLGQTSLLGGFSLNLFYTWRRGQAFTWNPAEVPGVEDNLRWRPYQRWDLRLTKTLFREGAFETVFYLDVTNLFNHRIMTVFTGQDDPNVTDEGWAWNGHSWWKNQDRAYLESLGYTAENQNTDGSFDGTIGRPGDWKDGRIDLPDFSPWTFLGRRDVYFGVKLYF